LKILSDSFSPGSAQNKIRITASPEVLDGSFVSEHIGKQIFIPGGTLAIAETSEEGTGQSAQINPFHMDEFFVTNLQFADFLNHNLPKIKIDGEVVKNGDEVLLLLGEVRSGYEPLIYRRGKFHITDPTFASSPVLRVTGYGALAFSKFFGRRLPTEPEMLYAMFKGADNQKQKRRAELTKRSKKEMAQGMMRMMGDWNSETERWSMENWSTPSTDQDLSSLNNVKSKTPEFLLSALTFSPNILGIKGLNHEIGEWAYMEQAYSSQEPTKTIRFSVIGGVDGRAEGKISFSAFVKRFPWEAFEEIGFRTVKSTAPENS
jgi:serine/threonine-protein kinase